MTPTKLLIGQILVTFAIMVLGVWASTQWAAAMLADQPRLGAPWFTLGSLSFYRPWSLFGWWHVFSSSARAPRLLAQLNRTTSSSCAGDLRQIVEQVARKRLDSFDRSQPPKQCAASFAMHAGISLDIFSRCSIVGVKEADSRDCRHYFSEVRNACFCARSSSRTRTSPFRSGSDL